MPRVPPVTGKQDVAPEYHRVVDDLVAVFGNVRGPFSILMHSPGLAEHVLAAVRFLREDSVVPEPLRLLAILAAVRELQADYVWAAQVGLARRVGVSEASIDLLRAKGDVSALPAEEADVITLARQLMRAHRVEQAAFDRLRTRFGVQWLVELTAAINIYAVLAGIGNVFEVPPLPDGDRLPP
jgi:4-carboxymuconolactone decarboxylase